MRSFLKFIACLSIIPILIGLFFFSNIKGYYRFKDYCEKEGGLRMHEQLERNAGWLVQDMHNAEIVSKIAYVEFARYNNKSDGRSYDVRYLEGQSQESSSYEIRAAEEKLSALYRWENNIYFLDESRRLKKRIYEIYNSDNKEMASFTVFYYSPFGGNLGGPDWRICDHKSATNEYLSSAVATIFKN